MILIVDDFADGREVVCRLLTRMGYPCQGATSGQEALAIIRAHPPEQPLLVVLDAMMPDMDGVQTLQAIRDEPRIAQTTVIMFSAGFDLAMRADAILLGAAAWVLKGDETSIKEIVRWYERVGGVSSAPSSTKSSPAAIPTRSDASPKS